MAKHQNYVPMVLYLLQILQLYQSFCQRDDRCNDDANLSVVNSPEVEATADVDLDIPRGCPDKNYKSCHKSPVTVSGQPNENLPTPIADVELH